MGQKIFSFNIGGKSCMGLNERIAELEAENAKLKQENDQLLDIVVQMRSTLNRLIARYISSDSQEG